MALKETAVIILAAGLSKRMKSSFPKALHKILGKALITYPLKVALNLNASKIIVVVGERKELLFSIIEKEFPNAEIFFAFQEKPLGTAHAVLCAEKETEGFKNVLILNADLPLLKPETIFNLQKAFYNKGAIISILTAIFDNPTGYGRILKNRNGILLGIVEEKDANEKEKKIKQGYAGVMMANREFLFKNLKKIKCDNLQGEYYLTDIIKLACMEKVQIGEEILKDSLEVKQVNNRVELAEVEKILQQRKAKEFMLEGVSISDPERVYIEEDCKIGRDTFIYPEVYIKNGCEIGENCKIGPFVFIENSKIEDEVEIKPFCIINGSIIKRKAVIGPFSHIRPECTIFEKAKIGNFVELKKTVLGEGSKANHLSYLGDTLIGKGVNIGAGIITCNYDGFKKHQTIIEDDVFVGCDTQFVAPVRVKKGAYIASGTTVTEDVPEGSLAISRVPQKNVEGWVEKKKKKMNT